ncbi:type II toxin-antitoxin system VapC family toxin [soil metagenome]
MILVDSSIWIDHLHKTEAHLVTLLHSARVVQHKMVIGELALGNISGRDAVLENLNELPTLSVATHDEVMHLVEERRLFGQGLSLVDAHLLTSVALSPPARIWTRDKKLEAAASELGLAFAGR